MVSSPGFGSYYNNNISRYSRSLSLWLRNDNYLTCCWHTLAGSFFNRHDITLTGFVWLLADSFRNYFIGYSTLLFTFPLRYSFTIGLVWYLALECGHPSFRREFAVSQPTQESFLVLSQFRILDSHYLWSVIPNCSTIEIKTIEGPTTPG